jgi:hypothetical protein
MKRAHIHLMLIAALAASGCVRTIGNSGDGLSVAYNPEGVATTVLLRTESAITGELLEVRDNALVLRRGTEVLLVPTASIAHVEVQRGDRRTRTVTPDRFQRDLRLLSRYPSGISPSVMAALLSASGKAEPTVVR